MEKIQLIDADTLYYKALDHPKMLIEGILSNGLCILSGDSKIGKSWMVLWFCLKISKGEPLWGMPTTKTKVIYLALEDKEWRVQQRMQELTDEPPQNLHFAFSCGKIGFELESQIEDISKEHPDTGLLFIDTLQMVRDNTSSKVNAYAQDYKDLSSLKKLADRHNMCIFLVHHNRKEHDGNNIFHDMTGSTGIAGVADTCMILRKEERFGNSATLSITGRDIEEKQLRLIMNSNVWEVTEELHAEDIKKEKAPPILFCIADMVLTEKEFTGTMSELLSKVGAENMKPNAVSKIITKFYSDILKPMGIHYETKRQANARLITLVYSDDGHDGDDSSSDSDCESSFSSNDDGFIDAILLSSQSSSASQNQMEEELWISAEGMDIPFSQ